MPRGTTSTALEMDATRIVVEVVATQTDLLDCWENEREQHREPQRSEVGQDLRADVDRPVRHAEGESRPSRGEVEDRPEQEDDHPSFRRDSPDVDQSSTDITDAFCAARKPGHRHASN